MLEKIAYILHISKSLSIFFIFLTLLGKIDFFRGWKKKFRKIGYTNRYFFVTFSEHCTSFGTKKNNLATPGGRRVSHRYVNRGYVCILFWLLSLVFTFLLQESIYNFFFINSETIQAKKCLFTSIRH